MLTSLFFVYLSCSLSVVFNSSNIGEGFKQKAQEPGTERGQ